MSIRIGPCLLVCVIATSISSRLSAADAAPTTQPMMKAPAFFVSDMRVQTIAGFNYAYQSADTTFEKMIEPIGQSIAALQAASADGKLRPKGSLILIYQDLKGMDQPFKVDIGMPVEKDAAAPGPGFKVRKVEAFRCATVIYSGPMTGIGAAYQKLLTDMAQANLTPGTTAREFHLYFESPESPNNIVQIQMAIQ
jgi:effector-binding domain-containing protein